MIGIVSGYGFVDDSFTTMPDYSYDLLWLASNDLNSGSISHIIVAGGWSINYDLAGITPTHTEAQLMKHHLVKRLSVSSSLVIEEDSSRDTIGNAYFSKLRVMKLQENTIQVYCADFHKTRTQYIYSKVYGPTFNIFLQTCQTDIFNDRESMRAQELAFERQKQFLKPMIDGDHSWLSNKLYSDSYYVRKRPSLLARISMGRY